MATALVTGGSKGLGEAITRGLVRAGWSVVIDARHPEALSAVAESLGGRVRAVVGDIRRSAHQKELVAAAEDFGGLDLLVNNASSLGVSPLPRLSRYPAAQLRSLLVTNVAAPLAMIQVAAPLLRRAERPRVVNITSDASVEAYPGWGGYGASKAALDQIGAVLAAEEPTWRVWTVDPGDLRTEMHQAAFPGEDISDRPEPGQVVPAFLELIASDRPSGRYRLAELAEPAEVQV